MSTRRFGAGWATAAVAGLIVAGCSDGSDDNDGPGPDDMEGPLAEYIGYSALSSEHSRQRAYLAESALSDEQSQKQRRIEEWTAQCMRDEGFEYVPEEAEDSTGGPEYEEAFSLPPEEFARVHGYGISTLDEFAAMTEEGPNERIYQDLSSAAQLAYDEALYGDWEVIDKARAEGREAPVEDRGCANRAAEELLESGESLPGYTEEGESEEERIAEAEGMRQFSGLFGDIEAMFARIESDDRVKDAVNQWTHCMADRGYPDLSAVEDARYLVDDKHSKLLERQNGAGGDLEEESEVEVDVVSPDSSDEPGMGPNALTEELKEFELDVAVADFECQRDHYRGVLNDVGLELEKEFVEDHRQELEAYRQWAVENGDL